MKLFKLENYKVTVEPEVFTLKPFKDLLDRDKSKLKTRTFAEIAYVYHTADLKSDFAIITDKDEKKDAIKRRLVLEDGWEPDELVEAAIELYTERTITPQMKIFQDAMTAAIDMGEYLADAKNLLRERTDNGSVVTTAATISSALKAIPQVIKDLKTIESEVIREQSNMTEKNIGSRTLNTYEDGFIDM